MESYTINIGLYTLTDFIIYGTTRARKDQKEEESN